MIVGSHSCFLAPHNDDEVLFGSFTLLREHPHVVVCLRSQRQGADTHLVRERETAAAMEILGCRWGQWEIPDSDPDWDAMLVWIEKLSESYDHCYAPTPHVQENEWDETQPPPRGFGIVQHDAIGMMAEDAFDGRVTFYETYTKHGGKTTTGNEVPFEPEWVELKLRALAEYRSQIVLWPHHFINCQREFYAD